MPLEVHILTCFCKFVSGIRGNLHNTQYVGIHNFHRSKLYVVVDTDTCLKVTP